MPISKPSPSLSSVDSQKGMYEANWKNMTGLQMVNQVAIAGYELIKDLPKGRCLDIGCGDGTNSQNISRIGFKVEGIEISKIAVQKALAKGIPAQVVDLNVSKLPYKDNSFSLVWMSDVIEHLFWPEFVMAEIHRVLKPGGFLFISTPNFSWFGNRIQMLLGQTPRDLHPEHIYWFNLRTFNQLLSVSGFTFIKNGGYDRIFPFVVSQVLPFLSSLDKTKFAPPTLLTHTLFCLAKNQVK